MTSGAADMRSKRGSARKTPPTISCPAPASWLTSASPTAMYGSRAASRADRPFRPITNSMLAKLITYAETRDEALDKLSGALDRTSIFGITTNQSFLARLIALPETRNATFHTRLIDDQIHQLVDKTKGPMHGGVGARRLFLDDAATPAGGGRAFAQPLAVSRNHGVADVGRRRRIVANPAPASRGRRRQRRDQVCATAGRWQHD